MKKDTVKRDKEVLRLTEEIRILRLENTLLRNQIFGQKSERIAVQSDECFQENLFGELPSALTEDGVSKKEIPVETKQDKKGNRTRKPLPDALKRDENFIDLDEDEKKCSICGEEMVLIGEDITEKLAYQAALLFVIAYTRPKYACPKHPEGGVAQAELPAQIIEKGIPDASLIAWSIYAKFFLHLPLFRQEKLFAHYGCVVKRQRLSDWEQHVAKQLIPVVDAMRRQVDSSGYVQVDETTLPVQKKESNGKLATGYLWPRSDGFQVVFEFDPSRRGAVATQFLENFSGFIQTDGYSGYADVALRPDILRLTCWTHVRRKFVEALKSDEVFCSKVIDAIRELYDVEKIARKLWDKIDENADQDESPEEIARKKYAARFHLRIVEKVPGKIMALFELLESKRDSYTPKDPVTKAINYLLNMKEMLMVYLYDGRLEMDNNKIENSIRPITLGRKNWLFAGSQSGAKKVATMATIVGSAVMLGLEPYEYIHWLLQNLPLAITTEQYEALTPLSYSLRNQ
jgi:transposase